jgi:hypothetical protein
LTTTGNARTASIESYVSGTGTPTLRASSSVRRFDAAVETASGAASAMRVDGGSASRFRARTVVVSYPIGRTKLVDGAARAGPVLRELVFVERGDAAVGEPWPEVDERVAIRGVEVGVDVQERELAAEAGERLAERPLDQRYGALDVSRGETVSA